MNDDISQSVSQRGYGAYDEENRRIQEVSNELQRLCRLHEEEFGDSKANGNRFEIEQRAAEQFAKSVDMWIPMDNVFDLGGMVTRISVIKSGGVLVLDLPRRGYEITSGGTLQGVHQM